MPRADISAEMDTSDRRPFERCTTGLPGWLFLIGGLALLGLTLVMPGWMSLRELEWQRDVMQTQLEHLQAQHERYAAFFAALQSDDPVLLEHLAYTQLHFKPAGKELLPSGESGELSASIAAWLHEPLPQVGAQIEPLAPINSSLVRLTTGYSRFVLFGAAIACIGAGVASGKPVIRRPPPS